MVVHALRTLSGTRYGQIVAYTCEPLYIKTSGDLVRTCTANGTWNGTVPVCKGTCIHRRTQTYITIKYRVPDVVDNKQLPYNQPKMKIRIQILSTSQLQKIS